MIATSASQPITEAAWETAKAEKAFRHFVRQAWHVVEPATPFQHNWHIDDLCDHLQSLILWPPATHTPPIRNFLVTMPPRAMKSLIISVFFVPWAWIHKPELRFLYASYAQSLSTEHSQLSRMVIESEWYQSRWGHVYQLADDDNLKTRFSNSSRGQRIATSVGASVTGFGGDFVICDDPHNVQQAESDSVRQSAVDWWNRAMSTRLNNPSTGVRIVVMQRVHESDVAGSVLAKGNYTHMNLPMEYEPTDYVSPIGWSDPRMEEGELLWPSRYDADKIATFKADLGSYAYASQFQQHPAPAEGGMFKRHWWRYWQPRGSNLPAIPVKMPNGETRHIYADDQPAWWDRSAQSWDMTFKETKTGSYVVGLVGAISGTKGYVLDLYRDRVEFTGAVQAVRSMHAKYPDIGANLIEDKANGPAVIDTLRNEIPGIIATSVEGSKEARAASSTARVEAGNWYLPHPQIAPWVNDFIKELAAFPTGSHDDQVDSFSQLDRYFYSGVGDLSALRKRMDRELGRR